MMDQAWWQSFFDETYLGLWGESLSESRSASEAEGLWDVLQLCEGSRILDAPCGWGRVANLLARRGAIVLAVDQSAAMIERGERERGGLGSERLRYLRHDLREPLPESGFDAAYNIFSSIGYGTEDDDLAVFRTLRAAVRPGGWVFIETMHRDPAVAFFSRGARPAMRLRDGTLVVEEPVFDALMGRVNTAWHWWGPNGNGTKTATLRTYCATELIALLERAGLKYVSAHRGCSSELFTASGPDMGGRLGLLTRRED